MPMAPTCPNDACHRADLPLESLTDILLRTGQCDVRALERGRRVAEETGQRLDKVLIQLGLVSSAGWPTPTRRCSTCRSPAPISYPAEPAAVRRPPGRALPAPRARHADGDGRRPLVAGAGRSARPLHPGRRSPPPPGMSVRLEIAVPIELDAALKRLYPDEARRRPARRRRRRAARGGHRAAEGPGERGAGHPAGQPADHPRRRDARLRHPHRAVRGPAARALPHRRRAARGRDAAARLHAADHLAHQDHGAARHRRAPAAAGRPHQARRCAASEIDFRVSTLPTLYGEKRRDAHPRPRRRASSTIATLGLRRPMITQVQRERSTLPNGIVLVTGPTGSGKTTTLYTGAAGAQHGRRARSSPSRTRSNTSCTASTRSRCKPQIGLTFASLLRSILRQDPDVIMVGEIRDLETAQIAMQAALTGHLVLSTLHTNTAAAAITRLLDMGVEDYLLTSVLRGVLAQRLVRRLCPACRRPTPAPPELIERFELDRAGDGGADHAVSPGRLPRVPRHRLSRPARHRRIPDTRAGDRPPDLRRAPTMPASSARRSPTGMRPCSMPASRPRSPARRRSRKSCAASARRTDDAVLPLPRDRARRRRPARR